MKPYASPLPGRDNAPAQLRSALRFRVRSLVLWAIPVVSLCFALRDRVGSLGTKPVSDQFRRYLQDPKSQMVVYSPDFDVTTPQDTFRMQRQLSALREKFDGIVLYRCDRGTRQILQAAVALRYRAVLLTVWDPNSSEEVHTAADLVNRFSTQLAFAVSIGSEGLMERRYEPTDLQDAEQSLQSQLNAKKQVEITSTEPWWLYLNGAEHAQDLQQFGDFLAPNIHVVWDADLADPAAAAQWTLDRARELQTSLHRLVLIREAGFPGGGQSPRPGLHLSFSRALQAGFWRAIRDQQLSAGDRAMPIVAFEGFDNSAKDWHSFEGTWGLLNGDMQPYPAWTVFPALPGTAPSPAGRSQ